MTRFRYILPFLAAPAVGQGQRSDTARVAPVIVTATRAPLTQSSLPVAVVVLRGEDLRLRGITSVGEALNDVASAYVAESGSRGATTSLFLRGGESKYVKVLIDGVPANDPGGVYDFASLTTDNVDRIEIVRGPASVVHGADAVTGVVQIFTTKGTGPMRVESSARVGSASRAPGAAFRNTGSARTFDATTILRGELPGGSYSLGLARHDAGGLYELNNRYRNNAVSSRFTFAPDERTELRLALRYHDYQFNYPTNSAGDVTDSNAYRTEDRTVIGVEVERAVSASLRAIMALSSSVNHGGTDDGLDAAGRSFISQDKVRRRSMEVRGQWIRARAVVTVGLQREEQDQRSQYQSTSSFGPLNSLFKAARLNSAAFVEVVVSSAERLTATLGARVDDNGQFGAFSTGRVGLSWRPLTATRLRATAGNAFREPSFFENYATGFVVGNPGLTPEHAGSADVGIEQELARGRAVVSVTAFAQRFQDMINYSGGSACGFSYCNVAAAESNGLELEVRGRLGRGLSGAVSGTHLKTRVITPGYDTSAGGQYRAGESLIRRPKDKWTAELTYRGEGPVSGAVRVLSVGKRADRDFHFPATPVTLAAYQRVDVGAEFAPRAGRLRGTALTLRVENLLDESYQSVFNFLAPARTVTVGVRATY